MSQAALVFTRPSSAGKRGASSGSAAASAGLRSGLVKNEPALHVSWSAASSTMPLRARRASTVSRTSASGARPPTSTPSVRASSA